MKKTITLVTLLGMVCFSYGQGLDFEWAKEYGGIDADGAYYVTADQDGNTLITGYFDGAFEYDDGEDIQVISSIGSRDIFVQKQNAAGDVLWAIGLGGTGSDLSYEVKTDATGNSYVCGAFYETVDFNPGAGTENRTSAGGTDAFVLKLDPDGNFIWVQTFGGTGQDYAYTFDLDDSGNLYISGTYVGTVDFDPGAGVESMTTTEVHEAYVLKLASDGSFDWVRSLNGTSHSVIRCLETDPAGDLLLTGSFGETIDFDPGAGTQERTATGGSEDAFVAKWSAGGDFIWVNAFGDTEIDGAVHVTADQLGNVYVAGYFTGTVDFNVDPGEVAELSFTGVAAAFVKKMDASGDFQWVKHLWSPTYSTATGLVTDRANNVFLTGGYADSVDLDPGVGEIGVGALGSEDAYIIQLDTDGNLINHGTMNGAGYESSHGLAIAPDDVVYITGFFFDMVDFDPTAGVHNVTATGSDDATFLMKLKQTGLGLVVEQQPELLVYPNPTSAILVLKNVVTTEPLNVQVYDPLGRVVLEQTLTANDDNIDCSQLPDGHYILRVENTGYNAQFSVQR